MTQQNYGGRKLPDNTLPWRAIAGVILGLVAAAFIVVFARRRTRPQSRRAGLERLDRSLARREDLPVSIIHVSTHPAAMGSVAALLRPRLRRTDHICRLGAHGLLVICPSTGHDAAQALRRGLDEHLARQPEVTDHPVGLTLATAETPTSARRLLQQLATGRADAQPAHPAVNRRPTLVH